MTMHVTKIDTEGNALIAETFEDHYMEQDLDPETGKRPRILITAETAARARARCLACGLPEGHRVIMDAQAYIKPEAVE